MHFSEPLCFEAFKRVERAAIEQTGRERLRDCILYQYWLILFNKVLDHEEPGLVVFRLLPYLFVLGLNSLDGLAETVDFSRLNDSFVDLHRQPAIPILHQNQLVVMQFAGCRDLTELLMQA